MDSNLGGSSILKLLDSLAPEPLSEDIQDLFKAAYENMSTNPEKAIELGQRALITLDRLSSIPLGDSNVLAYEKGRCQLLVASIYVDLDVETSFERAEEHYLYGKDEFHSRQWSHLESLTYLGLAVARRKLKNFKEALIACKSAQDSVEHESIPSSIDTTFLRRAIQKERTTIQELLLVQEFAGELIRIPIVSDIAAALGLITEEYILDDIELSDYQRQGADFGMEVVGNSLIEDDIFPGDLALIRQQPSVNIGDIAAIVISTPEIKALGVLKHYYIVEENQEDLRHWLLAPSNPSEEHLVVMPSGVNEKAIRERYIKKINKVKFFENAELQIAGKYVKSIRRRRQEIS